MTSSKSNKANHYEEVIVQLCSQAKACGGYKEGFRDETTGQPYGMSVYALAAKQLWAFNRDGITPIPIEEASDPNKVFNAFYANYKKINDKSGDYLTDYALA